MSGHTAFSADGHSATWTTWDSSATEQLTLRWENEGWTATGEVERENVQYVLRLSATWQVQQFLLFRDLDEPDLWLATDGSARWGEMNGAHRIELDGCYDIALSITPFTDTLPMRRLPLHVGDSADLAVAHVDIETLGIVRQRRRYERVGERTWNVEQFGTGDGESEVTQSTRSVSFEVDEFGLTLDYPERFRRIA